MNASSIAQNKSAAGHDLSASIRHRSHVVAVAASAIAVANVMGQTALDRYVSQPDPTSSWALHNTIPGNEFTTYIVDMTSQSWRDPGEVNRSEWQHWLNVVIPDGAPIDTAMLHIAAGNNTGSAPSVDHQLTAAALAANSVMAKLHTVPNQPLRFSDESRNRSEDAIIAYTFDKRLAGGDEEWPLLLPMVKSAVTAMDTVQELVPAQTEGTLRINDFTVYGVSKRGWTTWLTAAVDPRVRAIAPTVIDVLNMDEQLPHHKAFYESVTDRIVGGYSWVLQDYVGFDIPDRLDTDEGQALLEVVDPYEYRDRYADIPKLIINATGDEFFVPDSWRCYFDDLPGEKYLRYMPNEGHGGFFETAVQFHQAVAHDVDLPDFSWTIEQGGRTISVLTEDTPIEVRIWQARNPSARDFRHSTNTPPPTWHDTMLSDVGGGQYVAQVPYPSTGATAFMVELVYDSGGVDPYTFTTGVSVVGPTARFDFDGDELVNVNDADSLVLAIAQGSDHGMFDLTVDGVVDGSDLQQWLASAADINAFTSDYRSGDANLDGVVDAADLNNLALNWQGEVASWSAGDFTADGNVDAADLNEVALNWQQEIPLASAVSATVPEPAALLLAILGCAVLRRPSRL
jgi:PhoPQ-activated pathogenicity-related protein